MKNKGFKALTALLIAAMMMTTNYVSYVTAEENTAVETLTEEDAEEKAKKEAEGQESTKTAAEVKHEPAPSEDNTVSETKEVVYGDLLDAPEMMIGVLKRTAKALKSIKKMWLAQRVEGSNRGYLLVVEAMAETDKAIEELKKASAGYLGDKIMEVRQADPSALQLVKDIKPFYKKGLFG